MEYNGKFKRFVLIMICFFLSGCMGSGIKSKTFLRKNFDISYIKKIAVLPFQNNSKNESASEIVRDITSTEILSMGIFDIVGKSIVDSVVKEEVGDEENPVFDKATILRISRKLHVDALLAGSVNSYENKRDGTYEYPAVTITLSLFDGKTGMVLWRTSGTKTGYKITERLLGVKPTDINELCFEVIEQLLEPLK